MKKIQRRSIDTLRSEFSAAVHPLLQRIYAARNVYHDDDISTALQHLLPPDQLAGLDTAVALLADYLQQQKRLLIIGDFDADGATSCALAVLALRAMGAQHVDFLVPNRFDYGYGLTPEIVAVAHEQQPDLIITVDNGISSIDGVQTANDFGIKVLITDHHLPGEQLPAAAAIINPNQPGCAFASKNLAGVGVVFYLLSALRSYLRQCGWFTQQQLTEPVMADYLDLVALGTVADVVPLDRNNRILVAQGLQRLRVGRTRPGIKALVEVAGRYLPELSSTDLGFVVGPRLNAAGRLTDMSLGIQCLLSDHPIAARSMAVQLDMLNRERRTIESTMQRDAIAHLEQLTIDDQQDLPYGLCLYDATWHQGVIGILASRIKDRYHRPVIVFANADDNTIKGSARSVAGLHIRDVLQSIATHHPGLLIKFGGHAMAAGLTLRRADYTAFADAFDQAVRNQLTPDDLQAVIISDGELQSGDFNLALAHQLRTASPWGQQFPEPLFDGIFHLQQQRLVGERHLKMRLAPLGQAQSPIDAIAFNIDEQLWPNNEVELLRVAYKLDVNRYQGRQSLQLLVDYMEPIDDDVGEVSNGSKITSRFGAGIFVDAKARIGEA